MLVPGTLTEEPGKKLGLWITGKWDNMWCLAAVKLFRIHRFSEKSIRNITLCWVACRFFFGKPALELTADRVVDAVQRLICGYHRGMDVVFIFFDRYKRHPSLGNTWSMGDHEKTDIIIEGAEKIHAPSSTTKSRAEVWPFGGFDRGNLSSFCCSCLARPVTYVRTVRSLPQLLPLPEGNSRGLRQVSLAGFPLKEKGGRRTFLGIIDAATVSLLCIVHFFWCALHRKRRSAWV